MPKGNPNPSPETRFTSSGNPAGKTAAQRQAEVKAAEIAADLRLKALIRMQEKIASGELDAMEAITSDNLRLFRDSEDRAHGTPKQSVEHGGEGGGPLIIQWRDAGS
jgi:hypothetical protein